jgi:hypothetical protein
MTFTQALGIAGLCLTAGSIVFAGWQFRQSRLTSQSEFLFKIVTWYLDDVQVREFFYKLDYNMWVFDARTFPGSPEEPLVDKTLLVFDLLGDLVEKKRIQGVPEILAFRSSRVLHNPQIAKYLQWLDEDYAAMGHRDPAFARARRLADRVRAEKMRDA